jgi:multiple sugar transport system ATP-binding protein
MGRAIVRDPKAFLMDEPLSNLDAKLRVQMRTEVARIQRSLGTTMVYVTHDQTEAMTLGDRVAVMRAGVIQQVDTPANLYEDPQNLFVAGFIGSPSMNFLPGRLEGDTVKLPFGDAPLPDKLRSRLQRQPGQGARDVIVGIRPEHFEDAAVEADTQDRMKFRTSVDVVESMGSELYVYFDVEAGDMDSAELNELAADAGMEDLPSHGSGQQVVARLSAESNAKPGAEVELTIDTSQMKLFDAGNGRSMTAAAA